MHRVSYMMLATLAVAALVAALTVSMADGTRSTAEADGNTCVAACRAAHDDCRIRTKGSSSCDGQLRACMQACVKR